MSDSGREDVIRKTYKTGCSDWIRIFVLNEWHEFRLTSPLLKYIEDNFKVIYDGDDFRANILKNSKEIYGFKGYFIYEDGYIYSERTRRFLSASSGRNGYLCVSLRNEEGVFKKVNVHREVAKAFIPNPNNYPQINHIDFDRTNPHVSNLEWCTQKMNDKHSWDAGRHKAGMGMLGHKGALHVDSIPVEMYSLDGTFIKDFASMAEASEYYGVGTSAISYCCSGKTKYPRFYIFKLKNK